MKEKLKESYFPTKSSREGGEARKRGGQGQKTEPGEVTERPRYEIYAQECFYGFARVVYDWVLDYAKLGISQLCFDWKSRGSEVKEQ